MARSSTATDDRESALAEVRKTKETAERVANGEAEEGADQIRVLAGMIHQLAEQVERLADGGLTSQVPGGRAGGDRSPNETDAPLEEDRTPEDAPAEPVNDRSKS
jgi:hypothetical protein